MCTLQMLPGLDRLPLFVAVHVPQQRRRSLQDTQGWLLCRGWAPPAVELKWPCGERQGCAGDGCQGLGGEGSPKSIDEPTPLHKRGRKAPAIQGSSAGGGKYTTLNSLAPGPSSVLTHWVSCHPVMHPGPGASHGLCVVLTSQSNVKDKPPKKPQKEAGSSTGMSPSKPPTLLCSLRASLSHRIITEKAQKMYFDKQVCVASSHWNNISACQSISSWKDLDIMRLRKSECEAEPQHKSHAICQSHQQPCRWDLTVKLPAQSLSALSPAADNAFSSKTLSHETKKLFDHRSELWILDSPFLIGDEHVIKRKKRKL